MRESSSFYHAYLPAVSTPTRLAYPIVQSEVDTNSVGHVICMKAEELKASCVLMGSHNKGPVAEFFMGSVSQYVSHHCKQPVVIVKHS